MRVIGVLDVMGGQAVHARGGQRERYAPIERIADVDVHGDAVTLALLYRERFGVEELYAADLDAITRGTKPDLVIRSIAALSPVWLDAGVSSAEAAREGLHSGIARVVVGLETLSSFDALAEVCQAVGGDRVAFSLDLRHGAPIVRALPTDARQRIQHTKVGADVRATDRPEQIARRAAAAGAGAVIMLDLARVGAGAGVDLDMLRRVREAVPDVLLLAGGGIRGLDDLLAIAAAGCDGALVATAVYEGRLTPAQIAAARGWRRA
jgi:phosphoribosylformimino-5-aminoimidazole carboxamide ribotide isomerase